MTSLFIATPCYGGKVNVFFMESIINLIFECKKNNISCSFFQIPFESLIPRARNVCAAAFIKSKFTHMIFIDSDIEFNAVDVIQMINTDVDIIGGSYPTKNLNMHLLKAACSEERTYSNKDLYSKSVNYTSKKFKEKLTENNNKKIECEYLATGFMLIKKNVFTKIVDECKNIKYTNDIPAYNKYCINNELYDFFQSKIINDKYVSEDYGFCKLWESVGGKVYSDLTVKLNHIGNFTYYGNPLMK